LSEPIPPMTTPLREAIERQLGDPALRHAILIDPALGDPFAEPRLAEQLTTHALPLPEDKVVQDMRPYLLPVKVGDPLLARSIELAANEADAWHVGTGMARSVCAWVSYVGDVQPLAQALGQKATLMLDETQTLLFRYYDPRVTTHLFRWLRPAQFFNGLPVLKHWAYLNAHRQLDVLSQSDEVESPAPVWFMTHAQRQGVGSIEALNMALRRMDNDPRHIDALLSALDRASVVHGLTETSDLTAFAIQAVLCHPKFDRHPEVSSALADVARHGDSFAEWLDSQDDATWQRIASELARASHPGA